MKIISTLKEAKISALIVKELENGKDIEEAMNKVLGKDTYQKLVSELYDRLNGKR